MQVAPVPPSYQPLPVTPVPPVTARKDNDGDSDNGSGADDKVKAATPPGVGGLLDISA